MTLTELGEEPAVRLKGAITRRADHEARMVRAIEATQAKWSEALVEARARWNAWLASRPRAADGEMAFGPAVSAIEADTLDALWRELR